MITNKIYCLTILSISVVLSSCSSSGDSPSFKEKDGVLIDDQGRRLDRRTGRFIHVEVLDNKDSGAAFENKNKKAEEEYLEIFKRKKQWTKMGDVAKEIRRYKDMSFSQIKSVLRTADEEETTLIIEALKQRGESGVEIIAGLLNDSRKAKFSGREPIFWYEAKNQPPEPVEIRVFAASQLSELLAAKPKSVVFGYHNQPTSDLGSVNVMYATQGQYALNKEDVCKVWLDWWSKFKTDFTNQ